METPQATFIDGRIKLIVGDLTEQAVDAIVNAANATLLGGGGVDGAIHRRGGPKILDACREIRRTCWPAGLPTGEAVITEAGDLPARYVIHTVGPIYGKHRGQESLLLGNCYRNALALAAEHGVKSIAFPAISSGVYGYPPEEAAQVVSLALEDALKVSHTVDDIRLLFFNQAQFATFLAHQQFSR